MIVIKTSVKCQSDQEMQSPYSVIRICSRREIGQYDVLWLTE